MKVFFEMVQEADTITICRYLARTNGLLAGGSTGTVLCGVKSWCDRIPPDATVVATSAMISSIFEAIDTFPLQG